MLDRRDFLFSSVLGAVGACAGQTLVQAEELVSTATAREPHPISETFDIRYYSGSSRHKLDIFTPRNLHRNPVVLFVHGGTWMVGDKNFFGQYRGVGRFLARNGVTAVLINYRLSPRVKHPEHARDVARAFAWTVRNIARYGGDPNRLILAGHSAGGHLATLVATDQTYLADPELKLGSDIHKVIKGVVGISGVYRVPSPEEFRVMLGHIVKNLSGSSTWMAPMLMKVGEAANPFSLVFGTDRNVQLAASPMTHIHKGLPPFLVLYAAAEVPGLAQQAVDFARDLKKVGISVALQQIPGATHRTILFHLNNPDDLAGKALLDFVRTTTREPVRAAEAHS